MWRDRWSGIPRGKIKKITFGPGITWDEFVIVTAKDIPGKNCIALITDDQPCLADGVVNHPEEPILLLAHANRYVLPKAVEAVVIEYDPLPALFTIEESESKQRLSGGRITFSRGTCSKKATSIVFGQKPITSSKVNIGLGRRNNSTSRTMG